MSISSQLRYQWISGTGMVADARQRWASAPLRRFPHRVHESPGGALSTAYLGYPEGLTYILPYVVEQQTAITDEWLSTVDREPLTWTGIRKAVARPAADIMVVGCSRGQAWALPRSRSLVLPFRMNLLLDVVGDVDAMYKTVSKNERRQFANLRKRREWSAEIGTTDADFDFFYERMHLPTMDLRHGEDTRSVAKPIAYRELFQRGFVLFVKEGEKRVAGVLVRLEDEDRTVRMRLLGALDGDESHYWSGAVKAVYYLTMEWAAANGCTLIDFAGCDPFPGRGVFQFKRRFHPRAVLPEDHYRNRRVYFQIARDTPIVRDFLVATPMFATDEHDRIHAVHFADSTRPPRTNIRGDGPGVHACRTIDLDEFFSDRGNTP